MTVTQRTIFNELCTTLELLGAESDLLSLVCSMGDTLPDDMVLDKLRAWNRDKLQAAFERKAAIDLYDKYLNKDYWEEANIDADELRLKFATFCDRWQARGSDREEFTSDLIDLYLCAQVPEEMLHTHSQAELESIANHSRL